MKRLITVPGVGGREPPPDLLRQLREIDAAAELFHVGEGVWWLGCVLLTEQRVKDGANILYNEEKRDFPNPRNVLLGKLAQQGFARIQAYTEIGGGPDGPVHDEEKTATSIVEDFRARDWAWKNDPETAFKRRLAASDLNSERVEKEGQLLEWLRTDGRAMYRREIRHRVSFGPGGVTSGGAEKITV